jgi:hypothetical protein
VDSHAYLALSHPARALLIEIARQYVGDNNGRLLVSGKVLGKRGWNSADVITRAKKALLEAKFIFETVKGQRPNKASWYAITWRALDRHEGFDEGADMLFRKGAFRNIALAKPKPTREELYSRWANAGEIAGVTPSDGVEGATTAPPRNDCSPSVGPANGAVVSQTATRLHRQPETI